MSWASFTRVSHEWLWRTWTSEYLRYFFSVKMSKSACSVLHVFLLDRQECRSIGSVCTHNSANTMTLSPRNDFVTIWVCQTSLPPSSFSSPGNYFSPAYEIIYIRRCTYIPYSLSSYTQLVFNWTARETTNNLPLAIWTPSPHRHLQEDSYTDRSDFVMF